VDVTRKRTTYTNEIDPSRISQPRPLNSSPRGGTPLGEPRPQQDGPVVVDREGRVLLPPSAGQEVRTRDDEVRYPGQRDGDTILALVEQPDLHVGVVRVMVVEQAGHDEVGARSNEGARPAEDDREGQGHEQLSRGYNEVLPRRYTMVRTD